MILKISGNNTYIHLSRVYHYVSFCNKLFFGWVLHVLISAIDYWFLITTIKNSISLFGDLNLYVYFGIQQKKMRHNLVYDYTHDEEWSFALDVLSDFFLHNILLVQWLRTIICLNHSTTGTSVKGLGNNRTSAVVLGSNLRVSIFRGFLMIVGFLLLTSVWIRIFGLKCCIRVVSRLLTVVRIQTGKLFAAP